MIKSKKQMYIVIGVFALVMLLGEITYAFFNYTRTGSSNVIRVGRIFFESKNEETITLNNLFPIDPSEQGIMNDTTKVGTYSIDIKGDTDYVDGIEYLITTSDAHIYTSEGKRVPISLDISVNNLGDESSTYFASRNTKNANIYKIMSVGQIVGEQQLVVGYIAPNTTSGSIEGIDGSITIKAYLDKNKIAITDTPEENTEWQEGRTVVSTSEWNALQSSGVSFKVKVEANEGIWVGEPFYDVMKRSAVMDNINSTYVNNATPGIDFEQISSDTNGKGIYTYSSTANDAYPIMYYRGDVDNNVLFGGFCWKIVRTTDTGGIKLIYNGNPVNNQCGSDRIIEKNQDITVQIADFNQFSLTFGDTYEYDSTNKVFNITGNTSQVTVSSSTITSLIGKYFCNDFQVSSTCGSILKVESYDSTTESIVLKQITQDSSIMLDNNDPNRDNVFYNIVMNSPASVGYMYGVNYVVNNERPGPSGTSPYMGSGFIYENGVYKLTNPETFSATSGMMNTHHYTCGSTNPNATCESIRYYISSFRAGTNYFLYITLTDGKSVEDALNEMFTNTHDSLAKTMIDTWYSNNMTKHTNELEDAIYCNDRSIRNLGGFNPDGGSTSSGEFALFFDGTRGIELNNGLICKQKRDSFTMNAEKGNGKLDYPVGMLTYYETVLAGSKFYIDNPNTSFYLHDGNGYWTMTPSVFALISYIQRVYAGGNTGETRPDHTGYMSGFRPVISLKEGTSVTSGNGTPTNPYVVE